ncbi:MAG: hypothetical protein ACI8X5_003396 [Planctomycetota bacterium]|jgi:hypothetical protein
MFRVTLLLLLTAMTGVAGWWTYNNREGLRTAVELERTLANVERLESELSVSQEDLEASRVEIAEKAKEIQELQLRLALLKIDHRVARIEVVSQGPSADDPTKMQTTVRFIEFDEEGKQVGAEQEITIEGKRLYLESLVIKFDDDYVEAGEFLRGTSLCLFNRVFSESVAPIDGVEIDQRSGHPHPYSGGDSKDEMFQAELWEKFWEYANDPEAANEKGVRAIHGEAPFMEVRPGRSYKVELRSSGGLSIQAE